MEKIKWLQAATQSKQMAVDTLVKGTSKGSTAGAEPMEVEQSDPAPKLAPRPLGTCPILHFHEFECIVVSSHK